MPPVEALDRLLRSAGHGARGTYAAGVIPSTRVEDEKIGPIADDVKDKVRETGQEALEHGKQVAQDAAQSARRGPLRRRRGSRGAQELLEPGRLLLPPAQSQETAKESGQQHAQEVKDSAQQSAQDVKAEGTPDNAATPPSTPIA